MGGPEAVTQVAAFVATVKKDMVNDAQKGHAHG